MTELYKYNLLTRTSCMSMSSSDTYPAKNIEVVSGLAINFTNKLYKTPDIIIDRTLTDSYQIAAALCMIPLRRLPERPSLQI